MSYNHASIGSTCLLIVAGSANTERPPRLYLAAYWLVSQYVLPCCRGVGPRALSNGINSAVFFCFFEALRGSFKKRKALVSARPI